MTKKASLNEKLEINFLRNCKKVLDKSIDSFKNKEKKLMKQDN
ncbi:hypothetical protein AAJ76_1910002127 [Vairimorpha ceranae]|uniref:Uncharacterized protein n=1 Tax=Vairimorpha ceranae TaxID=40302 RepID=A0A0F9W816_9MICR|nr:hypothetical protein AAJ76_1910002127 [Vairimorpha ceranae]KKO73876.1 hypothetical protein AAJ76_1910002127 [Vairimorpha ceranae]